MPKTIFKTRFGSHLYGTNSESSDSDVKGIYLSYLSDIILKKDVPTLYSTSGGSNSKNSSSDTDIELKDLRKFIDDCLKGQTYALDMIFAPKEFWLESSEVWEDLIANRDKLLSKQVAPFMGYCRQQAGKYGLKGSRLGELLALIKVLENSDDKFLSDVLDKIQYSEFIKQSHTVNKVTGHIEHFLEVLGSSYQLNQKVSDILRLLHIKKNKYGNRAELAMENQGIDWKAISHAFRCMYQLEELFLTHNIVFPLAKAEWLKKIKYGKFEELGFKDYGEVQDELYRLMEYVTNLETTLPEHPNYEFWNNWILEQYNIASIEVPVPIKVPSNEKVYFQSINKLPEKLGWDCGCTRGCHGFMIQIRQVFCEACESVLNQTGLPVKLCNKCSTELKECKFCRKNISENIES